MLLLYSGPLSSIFPPISFPPVPLLRSHLSLQLFFVLPSQLFIIFLTRLTLLLCFFFFFQLPRPFLVGCSSHFPLSPTTTRFLSYHPIKSSHFSHFATWFILLPSQLSLALCFSFTSCPIYSHIFLFNSHICYQLHCSWFNKYVVVPPTTVARWWSPRPCVPCNLALLKIGPRSKNKLPTLPGCEKNPPV